MTMKKLQHIWVYTAFREPLRTYERYRRASGPIITTQPFSLCLVLRKLSSSDDWYRFRELFRRCPFHIISNRCGHNFPMEVTRGKKMSARVCVYTRMAIVIDINLGIRVRSMRKCRDSMDFWERLISVQFHPLKRKRLLIMTQITVKTQLYLTWNILLEKGGGGYSTLCCLFTSFAELKSFSSKYVNWQSL